MKKLVLFVFTLTLSVAAYAQPNLAVAVDSPATAISSGQQFTFAWTVKNTGTVAFNTTDTIYFLPVINGGYVNNGSGNAVVWGYTNQSIPVGDSLTFSRPWGLSGGSSTTFELCMDHIAFGAAWTGVTESDTLDNECMMVQYTTVGMSEFRELHMEDNSYYANGIYYLRLENALGCRNINMTVFNITGQMVQQELLDGGSGNISSDVNIISNQRGIYIIKLTNENGETISTKKVMID